MSEFENACLDWYSENVNQFTKESGFLPVLLGEIKLETKTRRIFLKAMNMIYQVVDLVSNDKAQRDAERMRRGG